MKQCGHPYSSIWADAPSAHFALYFNSSLDLCQAHVELTDGEEDLNANMAGKNFKFMITATQEKGRERSARIRVVMWVVWIFRPILQWQSDLLHLGSHTVHGLAHAPVSFKNCSSEVMCFGWSKSWGRFWGWPFAVRCLQHVAVCNGHVSKTCSMVWTGSPHGQATWSPVWQGKNHCVYEPINACPVIIQYNVHSVKHENLIVSCLTRNVGCTHPSGDLVKAVLYARKECDIWCQCLAHVVVAFSLVFFFCALIVWGSSTSLRSVVSIISRASCFTLLKLIKRMFLGSHSSEMFRFKWVFRSSPICLRYSIETAHLSCNEASSTLLIAKCEDRIMMMY